jgi:hypothetical protein
VSDIKVVGWGPFRVPGERKRWERAAREAEALGYELPDYTSGDYLRDMERPLVERARAYCAPPNDDDAEVSR